MKSNWPLHQLSEFINVKHGFAFKGEFFQSEETPDLLVTPGNFAIGGGFKADKFKYYDGPVLEDYILSQDDLVITMTDLSKEADTLGYSALIPELVGHRLLHNQRVGLVEFKNDELDKTYLYFLLRSREYRHHVIGGATGTTVKHTSPTKIMSFEFKKPPKDIQIGIGKKLIALEKKIEFNRQTNQTLEAIAQAIFKSWFVDFDPTRAKIAANECALARTAGVSTEELIAQLLEDGRWTKNQAQTIAQGDPELAAMSAICGQFISAAANKGHETNEPYPQLTPEKLEELRQTAALFPSALVDSELGEIPEGWEIGNIGDIAIAKGGYAFKGKSFINVGNPVIKIKNITGDGRVDIQGTVCIDDEQAKLAERFKLSDGDLLMAMTGATVGKIGFVVTEGKAIYLNQRVAKFESKQFGRKISWFLFCCFRRDPIFDSVVSAAQGSAQPNISSNGIETIKIIKPNAEMISRFCDITDSIFRQWLGLVSESSMLEKSRDALLPKLLCGEIEVN
ncbi:restriction endonuclease subunit S [Reinekea forsetii]|nr:restriction endonuclease subunit S [Reinekea forsetii]